LRHNIATTIIGEIAVKEPSDSKIDVPETTGTDQLALASEGGPAGFGKLLLQMPFAIEIERDLSPVRDISDLLGGAEET
jgi:hypothetical protein